MMRCSVSNSVRRRAAGRVDYFLLGMIGAVLLATVLPQAGRSGGWLHLDVVGDIGIFLIFFLHGMGLSTESLREGASRWKLHLLVQLCTYAMFPLWWLALDLVFGRWMTPDMRMGFFYLAILPSTVSSSVAMTSVARGNVAAAVLNASLSTLLGVVITPLLASLLYHSQSSGDAMPLADTMLKVAKMLLLPFVLGQILRRWVGAWYKKAKPVANMVDRGVILLLVWCSFSDAVSGGLWTAHGPTLLAITLVGAALFLFPMLFITRRLAHAFGFPVEDEITAVFCGSKKSMASGVPMARLLFAGQPVLGTVVLPIMFYHQLQLFVCAVLARRYAARDGGPAAADVKAQTQPVAAPAPAAASTTRAS
jgi:solute carrier family 10 (sodium/bile acid cotransporter), member 7